MFVARTNGDFTGYTTNRVIWTIWVCRKMVSTPQKWISLEYSWIQHVFKQLYMIWTTWVVLKMVYLSGCVFIERRNCWKNLFVLWRATQCQTKPRFKGLEPTTTFGKWPWERGLPCGGLPQIPWYRWCNAPHPSTVPLIFTYVFDGPMFIVVFCYVFCIFHLRQTYWSMCVRSLFVGHNIFNYIYKHIRYHMFCWLNIVSIGRYHNFHIIPLLQIG